MNNAQALTLAQLAVGDYAPIRSAYRVEIQGAIIEYLYTEGAKVTKYRNAFKRAIAVAFEEAFNQGYRDGGGDPAQRERGDQQWLNAKMDGEFGYVDMLFQQLRELRSDPEADAAEYQTEAERRSEGYAKTLDGVYSEGKIRGAKNIMLTFGGEDGQESCRECQKYKGQRHRASWWIRRGLVPRQPGNAAFTCHGYNCRHLLFDDMGRVYTI